MAALDSGGTPQRPRTPHARHRGGGGAGAGAAPLRTRARAHSGSLAGQGQAAAGRGGCWGRRHRQSPSGAWRVPPRGSRREGGGGGAGGGWRAITSGAGGLGPWSGSPQAQRQQQAPLRLRPEEELRAEQRGKRMGGMPGSGGRPVPPARRHPSRAAAPRTLRSQLLPYDFYFSPLRLCSGLLRLLHTGARARASPPAPGRLQLRRFQQLIRLGHLLSAGSLQRGGNGIICMHPASRQPCLPLSARGDGSRLLRLLLQVASLV